MKYEGALIRPPSESQSLVLQITVGCSHNDCHHCGLYRDKEFRVKEIEDVLSDIKEGGHFKFRRVFLCDADPLSAPFDYLLRVLQTVKKELDFVERVSCFADPASVLSKTPAELVKLRELGLSLLYFGLDSGDDETLASVNRKATLKSSLDAAKRIKQAGIQLSAITLLGIGGRKNSKRHAVATANALNQIEPDFIGVVTTMIDEDAPLFDAAQEGTFQLPSRLGLVEELRMLLEHLNLKKGLLTTNHSSNYLPLRVVLPYQKQDALKYLQAIIDTRDESMLKPDFLRDL